MLRGHHRRIHAAGRRDPARGGLLRRVGLARIRGARRDIRVDAAPVRLPIARLRLGELELVTLPGEPTYAAGQQLGQGPARWIVACAQDHVGYFADRAGFRRGGYEAEMSFFGPDVVDRWSKRPTADDATTTPGSAPTAPATTRSCTFGPRRAKPAPWDSDVAHGLRLGPEIRCPPRRPREPVIEAATLAGRPMDPAAPLGLATGTPARAWVLPVLVRAARTLQRQIPEEYLDEMEGIAEAAGVPYDAILLENVFLTLAEQPDPATLLPAPRPLHERRRARRGARAWARSCTARRSTGAWATVLKDRTVALVDGARRRARRSSASPGRAWSGRSARWAPRAIAITEESCAARRRHAPRRACPINLLHAPGRPARVGPGRRRPAGQRRRRARAATRSRSPTAERSTRASSR